MKRKYFPGHLNRRESVAMMFAFVLLGSAIAHAKPPSTSTEAQVQSGAAVYSQNCAECHGAKLEGFSGPPLTGSAFHRKYDSADKLYDFISTHMPLNAPGSLTKRQYVDVSAFLLSKDSRKPRKKPLEIGHGG